MGWKERFHALLSGLGSDLEPFGFSVYPREHSVRREEIYGWSSFHINVGKYSESISVGIDAGIRFEEVQRAISYGKALPLRQTGLMRQISTIAVTDRVLKPGGSRRWKITDAESADTARREIGNIFKSLGLPWFSRFGSKREVLNSLLMLPPFGDAKAPFVPHERWVVDAALAMVLGETQALAQIRDPAIAILGNEKLGLSSLTIEQYLDRISNYAVRFGGDF